MLGSFAAGAFGGLLKLAGFISFLLSLFGFAAGGSAAPLFLIGGIALFAWGCYLKYLSRQTVRVRS